jgi:hypothetical protein
MAKRVLWYFEELSYFVGLIIIIMYQKKNIGPPR